MIDLRLLGLSVNAFLREQLGFLAALQALHIMAVAMIGSSVIFFLSHRPLKLTLRKVHRGLIHEISSSDRFGTDRGHLSSIGHADLGANGDAPGWASA
jgi:hypothetical protein